MRETLLDLMRAGAKTHLSDDRFNELALAVFRFQFEHNIPYRKYCERRSRTPKDVAHWHDIPAVPTAAFKEVDFISGAPEDVKYVFKTSGTTRGMEKRGRHHIIDPAFYDTSLLSTFDHFVLTSVRMPILSLVARREEVPDSSLSYMASCILQNFGTEGSGFFVTDGRLQADLLEDTIAALRTPACLIGTSLAFFHWLEKKANSMKLPAGSRLMDTGGFKGEKREVPAPELRRLYEEKLGITAAFCVNEYGMTELCSQYYDDVLIHSRGAARRIKQGPPWLRARVVSPDTLEPVQRGDIGILQHFDLANFFSVSAVQTEDLAVEAAEGFELLGRAPGASPRGCSIAMDLLLSSVS